MSDDANQDLSKQVVYFVVCRSCFFYSELPERLIYADYRLQTDQVFAELSSSSSCQLSPVYQHAGGTSVWTKDFVSFILAKTFAKHITLSKHFVNFSLQNVFILGGLHENTKTKTFISTLGGTAPSAATGSGCWCPWSGQSAASQLAAGRPYFPSVSVRE